MSSSSFKTFHFDFSQFDSYRSGSIAQEPLFLKVQASKIALSPHTAESRNAARAKNHAVQSLLASSQEESLTHFADVPEDLLPDDRIAVMMVVGPNGGNPRYDLPDLYHVHFHLPERVTRLYAERTFKRLGRYFPHPKLCREGIQAPNSLESAIESFAHADQMITPWDTAVSILIQDPDLATSQVHTHAVVRNDHVAPSKALDPDQYNRVFDLATQISKQGAAKPNSGFARVRQSTEHDGTKMTAEFTWNDKEGNPIYEEGDPIMYYDLTDLTAEWSQEPASYATRSARNDTRLRSQTWSSDQGQPVDDKIVDETHAVELVSRRTLQATSGATWTVTNATPDHGLSVYPDTLNYDPAQYQLSIDVKNKYLRVLGSFVQFFSDVEMKTPIDNPKVPNIPDGWPFYFPKSLAQHFETPSKKALGTVTNVNTIMGIPMPTDPTKITVPWPQEAQAAQLLFGCAGTSRWDNHIVWPGFIVTGIFQFGIPLLFMAIGAAVTDTQWYKDFIADTQKVVAAIGVAFGPVGAGVTVGAALGNTKSVLFSFAGIIVGLLVKKGMEKLAAYVAAKMLAAQMVNAAPIVGWGFRVAAVALNFSQIAVSTGEILSSPAVLQIDIKREMTLAFTLKPDPKHGEPGDPSTAIWPAVAYNCVVIVNYENGTSYRSEQDLPATSSSAPLQFAFSPVGWGGKLQITANVFSKNGWLCGKYQSVMMPALPQDPNVGILKVEGNIKEQLVPLTLDTQYDYKQQVFYTDTEQHHWITGSVPTATQSNLSCSNVGNNLCKPVSLTINQEAFQIGYSFQASGQNLPLEDPKGPVDQGQMFTMQNISVLSSDQMQKRLKFPTFGFKVQPNIAYNTWGEGATPGTINNDNFILDSRTGEYHLRQVMLMNDKATFGLDDANLKSWGRFYIPHLDAVVVHPSRLVIAVSWEFSKIQILQLPSEPVDDKDAPEAQIISGQGLLQGLTHGPIAIAISPDGRVMLLETLNKRIQAFDTKGNPVPSFPAKLLLTLPAAQYMGDLDAGKFSKALQEQFQNNGLTYLFDLDPALEPVLEAAKLTKELIDAFAVEGISLTYNVESDGHTIDPKGSSFITVVTPGQAWTVTDPNLNHIYDIVKKDGALRVSDVLNNVSIDVIGKQQRWVIHDLAGANSYLAQVDPANAKDLKIFEYLAYMPLRQVDGVNYTYVDMAMEAKGYIYVLSHRDTGGLVKNTDYVLDIYNPDGSFLVRTPDPKLHTTGNMQYVSAARIAVDVWRNLFALNYATFKGPGGRTEPSVSQWMPTPPLFDLDNTTANFDVFKTGDMKAIRDIFTAHKITLTTAASIKTIAVDGHWSITDVAKQYDVIASVDKIYVYDISA